MAACCDALASLACRALFGDDDEKRGGLFSKPALSKPVLSRWRAVTRRKKSTQPAEVSLCLFDQPAPSPLLPVCSCVTATASTSRATSEPLRPKLPARSPTRSPAPFPARSSARSPARAGAISRARPATTVWPPPAYPPPKRPLPDLPVRASSATSFVTSPPSPPALPTPPRSRLLALPQEIRDEIYSHVFSSTRLSLGRRVSCRPSSSTTASPTASPSSPPYYPLVTRICPARHSLALLRVCRQITTELRADNEAWLGQVLFHFEDVATMVDVLGGALAAPRRRRVRQVRVRADVASRSAQAQLSALLRLLPCLQLDRLTILPPLPCRFHPEDAISCCCARGVAPVALLPPPPPSPSPLEELLLHGSGWRELCFVHHDTALLAVDRQSPGSLEAMMFSMGFWDADSEAYEEVFAPVEHTSRRAHLRLGSWTEAYADKKEYRLPQWRALLAARDVKEGGGERQRRHQRRRHRRNSRSTIDVFGMRDGTATRFLDSLADVHDGRLRGDDYMVVVRRGDGPGQPGSKKKSAGNNANKARNHGDTDSGFGSGSDTDGNKTRSKSSSSGTDGNSKTKSRNNGKPSPTWAALCPLLRPGDQPMPRARMRTRHDRYTHRDEYVVVGPLRSAGGLHGDGPEERGR